MAFGKRPNDSTYCARYGLPRSAMSETFIVGADDIGRASVLDGQVEAA